MCNYPLTQKYQVPVTILFLTFQSCSVYLMQYSISSTSSLLRRLKNLISICDSSTMTPYQVSEILTVWHFFTYINTASAHLLTRCLKVHLAILLQSNMSLITWLCCISGGLVVIYTKYIFSGIFYIITQIHI